MSNTAVTFKVTGKEYVLPKKLKVKQFLVMDMQMIMKIQEGSIDYKNSAESQKLMRWLVGFLKTLGIDTEEDDFEQLMELLLHQEFEAWLGGLFGNLQPSKS
jgi:hypothetical protein